MAHAIEHAFEFLVKLMVDGGDETSTHIAQAFVELAFEGGTAIGDDIQAGDSNHTGRENSRRVKNCPFE